MSRHLDDVDISVATVTLDEHARLRQAYNHRTISTRLRSQSPSVVADDEACCSPSPRSPRGEAPSSLSSASSIDSPALPACAPLRQLRGACANLSIVTGDSTPESITPPQLSQQQPPLTGRARLAPSLWVDAPESPPDASTSAPPPPPVDVMAKTYPVAGHGGGARPLSQRKQLQLYERVLTSALPGLYFGANAAARELPPLQRAGVTHVVNCAAAACADHHPAAFTYMRLYLKDSMREDIAAAFYDALEFIHEAISAGGAVFVHCQQGVSRSAAIVLAYLMWALIQHTRLAVQRASGIIAAPEG